MTPLRDNLDRAKTGYGQHRYRGNLARDVLGAVGTVQTANPWPRRVMGIAAAIALSAITFFAGSYIERRAAMTEVATETQAEPTSEKSTQVVAQRQPPQTSQETETTVAQANREQTPDFTLVPSLASASASSSDTNADAQTASAAQQSMDFSMSVPSSPMLFSLATLADQETQQTTSDGEEERS